MLIVDSAHNPAGISSLIETVCQYFPSNKKHMVFSAFRDKDLENMVSQLHCFDSVTFTTFMHPRAASAEQIYTASHLKNTRLEPDWKAAISQLQGEVKKEDIIVVSGSLNFIGQVRDWLRK